MASRWYKRSAARHGRPRAGPRSERNGSCSSRGREPFFCHTGGTGPFKVSVSDEKGELKHRDTHLSHAGKCHRSVLVSFHAADRQQSQSIKSNIRRIEELFVTTWKSSYSVLTLILKKSPTRCFGFCILYSCVFHVVLLAKQDPNNLPMSHI